VLPYVLIGHNSHLKVIKAKTLFDLTALNSELLARSRLIAFVTGEIVPVNVLVGSALAPSTFTRGRRAILDGRRLILRFTTGKVSSA
jgi:hypothetical protein